MVLHPIMEGYIITPFQTDTRKLCFMDMTVNGEPLGRIDLNLNYEITPKTAQNFRQVQEIEFSQQLKPDWGKEKYNF